MAYRLVCIYEIYDSSRLELRIEVSLDKGKSVSRFERKINIDQLLRDEDAINSQLLPLLNQVGLSSQPFRIPEVFLHDPTVIRILKYSPWTYVQNNGKGSIKKAKCPLLSVSNKDHSIGKLLGGELYIENPSNWKHNILVRFRYQGAVSSFLPQYSSIPFLSDGSLYVRDYEQESKMLLELANNYDSEHGTLSFDEFDTKRLLELNSKGWTIYVAKNDGQKKQLTVHSNSSGIVWFSTADYTAEDFAQQLLDGYLHNRNFRESDGNITIFKKQDVVESTDENIVKQLNISRDVSRIYSSSDQLSEKEIIYVEENIRTKLNAKLRSYQKEGVLWLLTQRKNKHGCLLADEMGLGKTIQIISYLLSIQTDKRCLIIAPTSITYNWKDEVLRFAPSLISRLCIVSYDMLRIHLEEYQELQFDTIVIDEAQIIKNRNTKKYQAISQLQCHHKIILTGTPIENSIDELWSHFVQLMPEMQILYKRLHSLGVQNFHETYVELTGKLLKPFILRRTKNEVLKDLPELTEKTIYVELSDVERKVYDNIHAFVLQALKTGVTGRLNSIVLESLLRLRQTCVSIDLLPKHLSHTNEKESSKLNIALDYIKQFLSEGRKILVFSQFVGALHQMESILELANIKFVKLYGDTTDRKTPVLQFNTDQSICVFLISLKAGGVGLNLTSADRVILLDDWWNPAVEDQAMGRAHRIGQKNNVLALRLVCKDTVEEKILLLQERKRHTIDMFNSVSNQLTMEELKELIL